MAAVVVATGGSSAPPSPDSASILASAMATATVEEARPAAPPPVAAPPAATASVGPAAAPRPDEAAAVFRERVAGAIAVTRIADAVDGFDAALALDPELGSCADVDSTLQALAVQGFAMGGDTEQHLITLLTERAGPRGIEVLFDLVVTRGGSKAATRAAELLARDDVRARGSAALRIAYDLRAAHTCGARKGLLERVGQDGDARSLRELSDAAAACADIANTPAYLDARRAVAARATNP